MSEIYSKYLSLNESKKHISLKNKKKLSEKSKKKAIKEWRRNISGYSEISDEDVKKYQSQLDEIGDKLEKAGISVKKVGQVNVEEVEGKGSEDYFTEEAWGHIELSKPIKDEDEFEKICDIVEPYIDNRLSDVKDIGDVGSEQLYITFKVVDRFWDNEDDELEESSKRKKRAKALKETTNYGDGKNAIKKAVRMLERNGFYVEDYRVEYEADYETDVAGEGEYLEDEWVYIDLEEPIKDDKDFNAIGKIILDSLKEQGYDWIDDVMYNSRVGDNNISFVLNNEIMYEKSNKKIDLKKSRISEKRKRLSEKDSKTFNKAFKDFEHLVREVAKEISLDMYIDDIWTNSEYEGRVIVTFDKKAPSQKVEALRKSLEDDIRVEKITKKDNGFVVIFKEKYRNLEESIKMKRLKESNTKRISFKQFKKLKESKMKKSLFSKRKLNESDSVTIEIDFGNYYECLRCLFKVEGENLGTDQLNWYTEVGMEMGIDPNSMCEWIKNDVELLSVDEIKKYKDLGDVSDEEAIDFAQERGYYMGEINGDVYFLVPLGE